LQIGWGGIVAQKDKQVTFKSSNRGLTKVPLQTIHGGHFNMSENRTFLLCVDTSNRGRAVDPGTGCLDRVDAVAGKTLWGG
jgi:hypothetical protein